MTEEFGLLQKHLEEAYSYDHIHDITKIDKWFIDKIAIIVEMENALKE